MRKLLPLAVLTVLLAGCTLDIKLNAAGQKVRPAWNDNVSSCKQLGKVTVSVMDHVGPVDRNDIKVRDELEVMARNEAATMGADTVKPLGEPDGGKQTWGAYQCGGQRLAPPVKAMNGPAGSSSTHATTYPAPSGS